MKIKFWGVRGSVPVPGPDTARYGGNTPCISLETKTGELLILDAGTGLCNFGRRLMTGPMGRGEGEVIILLSHCHWDHIQGFAFFTPIYFAGNQIWVYGNTGTQTHLVSIFEAQMNPNYSPFYTLANLAADFHFVDLTEEEFTIGEVHIRTVLVPHADIKSVGYRLEEEGKTFVYLTDITHPPDKMDPKALALAEGADILVHNANHSWKDYLDNNGWGYTVVKQAVDLAIAAGVKRLVLFHYSPDYNDQQVDQVIDAAEQYKNQRQTILALTPAYEVLELEL